MTERDGQYFWPTLNGMYDELNVPVFVTVDSDDVRDAADRTMSNVLYELDSVPDISQSLKEQAAFCVGQYLIDGLSQLDRERAFIGLQDILERMTYDSSTVVLAMLVRVSAATGEVSHG
jgi:hypothetical protein